jgi:hypothetical protein
MGVADKLATTPAGCDRIVTKRISPNSGRCAVETPWCTDSSQVFEFNCGSDPGDLCDETGALKNRKAEAAIVIEFDSKIRKITPVGMNLPPIVNFN